MAGKTASIAKITRPVLAGHYPRERLFRLIDRARKRQVLWVCGPPGSGKTTLVSSYIAYRRLPGLWFRLEKGDADPATFFHYLGLAARITAPRIRKPLPVPMPEQRSAIALFARRYFESLFIRLKAGSAIVFDDYQNVPADSAFHTMVRDGLSLIPPGVSVILISREHPPSPFARLRASQAMEIIGWKELRLSPRETQGIARLRWKGKRGTESIRNLHSMSGGWAAGFVLLLESADLPLMTARMAAQLTGLRRAGQILFYLSRRNYFTEVRTGPEPVYEYHPLFREFLRSRAADVFSEKYIYRVRGKAAAILEESGHGEEAAGILREIGDWHGFTRVLQK